MTWSPGFSDVTPSPTSSTTPAPFMAEDRGEQPLGVRARQREIVGVADAGGLDLDQDLARLRAVEVHIHDLQRLSRFQRDGGTCTHVPVPPSGLF
jgi:hypothetical protein